MKISLKKKINAVARDRRFYKEKKSQGVSIFHQKMGIIALPKTSEGNKRKHERKYLVSF